MSRGYTLFEVLVALAIVGMVLVAVPLLARDPRPGAETRAAAVELASALRQARGNAIARFHSEAFVLNTEKRTYRVGESGREEDIADYLKLSLYTARSEQVDETTGRIRFYPDGSATGGRITLSGAGRNYEVAVDWLTGAISVEP